MTKTWGFDTAAFSASSLFSAAYTSTADNPIKVTGGDITVDGLVFNSTSAGVLRYRPTGASSNGSGVDWWNTNGSFFSANSAVLPSVGNSITSGGTVRTQFGIPVVAGTAFTITVSYKQTSGTATLGKIALVGSDNIVLAAKDASITSAAVTGDTITYSGLVGHALTSVKIFYSRDNDTSGTSGAASGGINITQIVRVQ